MGLRLALGGLREGRHDVSRHPLVQVVAIADFDRIRQGAHTWLSEGIVRALR